MIFVIRWYVVMRRHRRKRCATKRQFSKLDTSLNWSGIKSFTRFYWLNNTTISFSFYLTLSNRVVFRCELALTWFLINLIATDLLLTTDTYCEISTTYLDKTLIQGMGFNIKICVYSSHQTLLGTRCHRLQKHYCDFYC